jgi:hypothetical protein
MLIIGLINLYPGILEEALDNARVPNRNSPGQGRYAMLVGLIDIRPFLKETFDNGCMPLPGCIPTPGGSLKQGGPACVIRFIDIDSLNIKETLDNLFVPKHGSPTQGRYAILVGLIDIDLRKYGLKTPPIFKTANPSL